MGAIHPAAVADAQGTVVIFTARALRAVNQYRNKKLASRQTAMARKQKRSRCWKRLARRKTFLRARSTRQRRDIEHKVTRAIANHAQAAGAKRLMVSDVRTIGIGKRLNPHAQQQVSGWSHGKQVDDLTSKRAAFGMALERQSEAYRSKTCPCCRTHHKPNGRHYRCASCRLVGHRNAGGAINQVRKAVHGSYGHGQPRTIMDRRPVRRRRSPNAGHGARE